MLYLKIKLWKTILLLLYLSYEDIRYRKISVYLLLAGYVMAAGYLIFARELELWEYLAGGCVGVFFLFLSMAGENIGTGDGVLIMLLGLLLGIRDQISLLLIAGMLCAAVAAALWITGRVGRKSRLPFVPFLLAGSCITLLPGCL